MTSVTQESSTNRVKTNSTDRLYRFLSRLSKTPYDSGFFLIELEASLLFDGSRTDQPTLDFKTTAAIAGMLDDSSREIAEHLHSKSSFYLRHFEDIAKVLGPRKAASKPLDLSTVIVKSHLDRIAEAAEKLKGLVPEVLLLEDDLSDINIQLDELLAEIESAKVSSPSRHKLRHRFTKLKQAVEEYSFRGAGELRKRLKRCRRDSKRSSY